MNQPRQQDIELSVIVKTLNEERNIGRCIEAILGTLQDIALEIVVADSGSSDRTIEIATAYPVTVVQLANTDERSCGIGPQLGFQHSRGRYVLLLDADMVLHAAFVRNALARMARDTRCGGIGGQLVERSGTGYEYDMRRAMHGEAPAQEQEVNWLDGGGLYRRDAVDSVGYLSNRNLHAYEEKELGLRLRHAGWRLYRVSDTAVDHYGHTIDTLALLRRRWRSGYAQASGESIRACFGKPILLQMALVHKALIAGLLAQLALLAAMLALPWNAAPLVVICSVLALAAAAQIYRKKSLKNAVYSLLHLNVFAIGLAKGLMKPQVDPALPIGSSIRKAGAAPVGSAK